MEIQHLKNIYDLNYDLEGSWGDLTVIDETFIDNCQIYLEEYLEKGYITSEQFLKHSDTLIYLKQIPNIKFSHSKITCKTDYSWVDFKTHITLPNGSVYMLEGDFSPAEGYVFKNLTKIQ